MSFNNLTPTTEDGARSTLLKHGLPLCLFALLLAVLGNGLMSLAILAGPIAAFWIVAKRDVYPFGLILRSKLETSEQDGDASNLAKFKRPLVSIVFGWTVILMAVCALSVIADLKSDIFARPGLIEHITGIPSVISQVLYHLAETDKAATAGVSFIALRIIGQTILLAVCLFSSITGSACLYWFVIHNREITSREASA